MCIAIYKPGDVSIKEDYLRESWLYNPDGAGFAFIKDGKVTIRKGYMGLKDFMAGYTDAFADHPRSPFLIHFRIRSMGDKTPSNTHPFPIEGGALIHNGTLTGTAARGGEGPSDTALFAEKYKQWLTYDRLSKYREEWEDAITFNKIATLYDDGTHIILNKIGWTECEGTWYSNSSFRPSRRTTSRYSQDDGPNYHSAYTRGGYAEGYPMGGAGMTH